MLNATNEDRKRLYNAFLGLTTEEECEAFLTDLFTITELQSAEQRLKVAKMLNEKKTCQYISEETGASTATVSRVNKCLNYGTGGYRHVLEKLSKGNK